MELIIKNRQISESAYNILVKLKKSLGNGLLRSIEDHGDNVLISCPFHKGGLESHPSCGVYARKDNSSKPFGMVHCFTCGYSATLPKFVGDVFGETQEFGENWLAKNFGNVLVDTFCALEPIQIDKVVEKEILDESILNKYDFYHPYMWKRKLTKEVIDKFRVGYDKETNSITFPIWNEYGALVGISKRNVDTKKFDMEHGIDKPVYLLNYIKQCGITNVYVVESQINALTMWGWGYPAIALFGTGSETQYKILNRSGIRVYNLCFDGDDAGHKAIGRFRKYINKDCIINVIKLPNGKDVNDLTKDEFDHLEII